MSNDSVTSDELHQYVDGELSPSRMAEVEAHLTTDPQAAAQVAAYRGQKTALHARFDGVIDEPLPAAMTSRGAIASVTIQRRAAMWRAALQVAAAAILLVAGWSAGWTMRGDDGATLTQRAALAHAVFTPERRHAVEVGADEEEHLVAWLSNRLGAPLKAPSLTGLGYSLVGGRLLSGAAGPAAQFMYENGEGVRVTLYVAADLPPGADTEFRFAEEQGLSVFFWTDGRLGFALSANTDRAALSRIAGEVYNQITV